MINVSECPAPADHIAPCAWLVLLILPALLSACATADLTRSEVNRDEDLLFRTIVIDVSLAEQADSERLTSRLIQKLDRYDLQVMSTAEAGADQVRDEPGVALLKIGELDRRIENVAYRRTYGRTSLTQMRGRKSRDVDVVTLRTTFMTAGADQILFQADYVARGPWYADSASVVASLAGPLVEQLAHNGLIAAR